jgi:hypothetical protein
VSFGSCGSCLYCIAAQARRHGGGTTGPIYGFIEGFCGKEGSVIAGSVCMVLERSYSSEVPPLSEAQPPVIKAAQTMDNNNAIFMK